jgi:hypothetical protein
VDLPLGRQPPGEPPESIPRPDRLEHPNGVGVAKPPHPQLGQAGVDVDEEAFVCARGVLEARTHGGALVEGLGHHGDGPGQQFRPVDAEQLLDV